jgi:hypothetical protein
MLPTATQTVRRPGQVVVPEVGLGESGSRWAATDRRRKQHDRWKSVTDRRITRALAPALTCGFLTIIHDP